MGSLLLSLDVRISWTTSGRRLASETSPTWKRSSGRGRPLTGSHRGVGLGPGKGNPLREALDELLRAVVAQAQSVAESGGISDHGAPTASSKPPIAAITSRIGIIALRTATVTSSVGIMTLRTATITSPVGTIALRTATITSPAATIT
jgi:hypothetical protein